MAPLCPISVVHVDQPSNDFNTLFAVLDADPERYVLSQPNVFPSAIGRSFYENVVPPSSVHLGWSSYAAIWFSAVSSRPVHATNAGRKSRGEVIIPIATWKLSFGTNSAVSRHTLHSGEIYAYPFTGTLVLNQLLALSDSELQQPSRRF